MLKKYEHSQADTDIKVTFEVLLSKEMNFPNSKVRILFGKPISDWETQMVEMEVKEIISAEFVYLTGILTMSRNFQSKNIPYKYIVEKQNGDIVYEHIHAESTNGEVVNRCLSVPSNVKTKFTKFDDVILGENRPKDRPAVHVLQLQGRQTATKWMLPRPSELDDSLFDFNAAFDRFH